MVIRNLALVKERIEKAAKRAGRNPAEIRLLPVTKTADIRQLQEVLMSGVSDIAENRVKDALLKYNLLGKTAKNAKWHMIGHLQTNKAALCLSIFDIIHSLDSIHLAREIDKQAYALGKHIDCLVEVNISGESSKYGISPSDIFSFVEEASRLPNVNLTGLMTIAPMARNKEDARPYFNSLRALRDGVISAGYRSIKELSMGMTQDFETAVEEGATIVRIGSAIFNNQAG
ncbi:MAG: YggS family pyridoxal phosphate-dependent enzyme [Candidatus Omnitrophica bacterium]|nr:YggS family pyridoxal phosphate-dependent enzyme [Candidatus Omnitrophota bacterium]